MAKHETPNGVWVLPADPTHMYHEVFDCESVVRHPVETIQSPGRHRRNGVTTDSPSAVYRVPFIDSNSMFEPSAQSRLYPGKWECPREWHDGIAVGFEYL